MSFPRRYPLTCDTRFDDTEQVFPSHTSVHLTPLEGAVGAIEGIEEGGAIEGIEGGGAIEGVGTAPLDLKGLERMEGDGIEWEKWAGVELEEVRVGKEALTVC